MIRTILKFQYRTLLILMPLSILPFMIILNNNIILILFSQSRFFNLFKQKDFFIHNFHASGIELSRWLKSYNTAMTIYSNLWVIASVIVVFFINKESINLIFTKLINFNIALFFSMTLGNKISNSDFITIKSSILRFLSASFIFNLGLGGCIAIFSLLKFYNIPIYVNIILLIFTFIIWYYYTNKQKRIKYIEYFL